MRQPIIVVSLVVVSLLALFGSAGAQGPVTITGAGASFPYPLYSRWFYDYAFVDNEARFNYQSIGSGGGIKQVTAKTVDFGASDAVLNDGQKAAAPGLQMLPTVAGAVVLGYNVKDADGKDLAGLQLTPDVIADIFLGKITKWNDNRITSLNPTLTLGDRQIIPAHRSDGSGTSFLFTSYLSQVSGEWKDKVGAGTSVNWPSGLAGKGNEGVAGLVTQTPGSIGYLELAYAVQNKIAYATVQNSAGKMVAPSLESVTAASSALSAQMPEDLGQLLVNAPGEDSYPIAGYTFLLVYQDTADCAKAEKMANFIVWAMGSDADKTTRELLYAPLAPNVKVMVLDHVTKNTCDAGKRPALSEAALARVNEMMQTLAK